MGCRLQREVREGRKRQAEMGVLPFQAPLQTPAVALNEVQEGLLSGVRARLEHVFKRTRKV
jgi:hypothetical protein